MTLAVKVALNPNTTNQPTFPGQFHTFRDAGTKYQNLGLSETICDVWHVWMIRIC